MANDVRQSANNAMIAASREMLGIRDQLRYNVLDHSPATRTRRSFRREKITRLKWSLWHGQIDEALGKVDDLASSIAPFKGTYARFNHLVKAPSALRTYIENNRSLIPNSLPDTF